MWMPAKIAPLRSRLTDAWQRRAISLKAASFALIGVINSLVDFGVFLWARELFRLPYPMPSHSAHRLADNRRSCIATRPEHQPYQTSRPIEQHSGV